MVSCPEVDLDATAMTSCPPASTSSRDILSRFREPSWLAMFVLVYQAVDKAGSELPPGGTRIHNKCVDRRPVHLQSTYRGEVYLFTSIRVVVDE